jgi:hypothetical protein
MTSMTAVSLRCSPISRPNISIATPIAVRSYRDAINDPSLEQTCTRHHCSLQNHVCTSNLRHNCRKGMVFCLFRQPNASPWRRLRKVQGVPKTRSSLLHRARSQRAAGHIHLIGVTY